MHAPSTAGWVMIAAGALLGGAGAALLVGLRPFARDTPAAYAARIAGTMLAMLGLLLIVFATALAARN